MFLHDEVAYEVFAITNDAGGTTTDAHVYVFESPSISGPAGPCL